MSLKPMGASFREMAERRGIDTNAAPTLGPVWRPHRDMITPEEVRDTLLQRQRQKESYVMLNGSDEGYVEPPPFPCTGMLRLDEDEVKGDSPHLAVECDTCSYSAAIDRYGYDPTAAGKLALVRANLPRAFEGPLDTSIVAQKDVLTTYREWWSWWERSDVVVRPIASRHLASTIPTPGLYGEPGRGKSRIVVAAARHVIKRHALDGVYWSLAALLDTQRPKDSRELRGDGEMAWQRALNCDLLVLDDIGAERPTEFAQERLQVLVDHRYNAALPILVASNLAPGTWEQMLGARTASRLRGMTVMLELGGTDLRGNRNLAAAA